MVSSAISVRRDWLKHSLLEPVLNQRQVVLQRCAKQ